METFDNRIILAVVGVLMLVTNLVTEVLKQILWSAIPTNLLVVIVAETLTLVSGFACAQVSGMQVLWYHVVAAIVAGLFVAYAAMFGFDKFKETMDKLAAIRKLRKG